MQASHSRSNAADDITPPQFLYPLINGFNPSPMANYDGFPGGVNLSTENHPPLQMLDYSRSFDDSPALGLSLDSTSNARSSEWVAFLYGYFWMAFLLRLYWGRLFITLPATSSEILHHMTQSFLNISSVAQRHQRNEAEQKRREELRQAFEHLKSTLPVTKQKSSKQSLLNQGMCACIYRYIFVYGYCCHSRCVYASTGRKY